MILLAIIAASEDKLQLCNTIIQKINRILEDIGYFKAQLAQFGNPGVGALNAKLEAIKEKEKECDLDDAEIKEWSGPEDEIKETSFDSEWVKEREFNERQISDASEYGFGLWVRYLHNIPEKSDGLANEWYHVARLTESYPLSDNSAPGDQTLAILLGRRSYRFGTYDVAEPSTSVTQDVQHGAHIDGVWTYLYFSYSRTGKAVGLYHAHQTQVVHFKVQHKDDHYYFRFIFGGQFLTYKGFHGQMANIVFGIGAGRFREELPADLAPPQTDILKSRDQTFLDEVTESVVVQKTKLEGSAFAEEYGFSGWFKFQGTGKHAVFRLGDNELALNVQKRDEVYVFGASTYS